ncbi:MAG TPA: PKD domain-containing protein [Baekduia sp.]|nr:PKD domain-containing protein [Baekduia sp.]
MPAAGAAWADAPGPLETIKAGGYGIYSVSAATAANGDVYVVYADHASPSASSATVRLVRRPFAGGRSAADPGFVTTTLGSGSGSGTQVPAVVALPGGGVLAAWADTTGLRVQAFGATGQPAGSQLVTGVVPLDVELAVDGTGRAYIAWMDDGTPSQISQHLNIRSPSGVISGPMTLGTDQLPLSPIEIAVRPSGGGVAAWPVVLGPQSSQLRARTFSTSGPTGAVVDVYHSTVGDSLRPTVAVDSTRAVVAWAQTVTPAGGDPRDAVFASLVGADGSFIAPQQVSSSALGATGVPQAAVNTSGALLVAYDQDALDGTTPVLSRRFPAGSNVVAGSDRLGYTGVRHLVQFGVPGSGSLRVVTTSTAPDGQAQIQDASADPFGVSPTTLASFGTGRTIFSTAATGDSAGDTYVAVVVDNGSTRDVMLATDDAAYPAVDTMTVPTNGVAGTPVTVSGAASDAVGPTTLSWTFGDGTGAQAGAGTQHTFAAPGLYAVTVAATDAASHEQTSVRYITVMPAPVTSPGTPTPGVTAAPSGGGGGATGGGNAGGGASGPASGTTDATGSKAPSSSVPPVGEFKVSMLARRHKVIGLLALGVLRGARVTVLCRSGCGSAGARLGSATATGKAKRPRIKARLRTGAVLEVRVSLAGRVTRYARFRILARSPYAARVAAGCLDGRGRVVTC